MKYAFLAMAPALLISAMPAFATQGLECQSPGHPGFELYVSVGSGGGVDLVTITEGGREMRATGLPGANPRIVHGFRTGGGWLTVRIDGRNGRTRVARFYVRSSRHGEDGVLRYRGRSWPLSCRWEPQE